ncbi:hypothetical protein [Yersinia alsatica]|uniref:hypothetical protein n=1 Tax=Yersinia alsatica TaxID=2890317 RepID=UPI0011A80E0B|nr:hypothetical protein [Yersinia alsatica]
MKMAGALFFYIFWFSWLFCFISLLSVEFVPDLVRYLYSSYFGIAFFEDVYSPLIATLLWSSLILAVAIILLIYLFFKRNDDIQY